MFGKKWNRFGKKWSFLLVLIGLLGATPIGAQDCAPVTDDIVSWWPGEGDASDIIGDNPGMPIGGVTFADGMVGQAFNFNGINGFVRIPNSASLQPQQLSADAWVFPRTVGDFHDVLGPVVFVKDRGSVPGASISYGLFGPGTTGKFTAGVVFTDGTGATIISTNTFSFNQWYHIAMTWNGATLQLYVNGNLEGSSDTGSPRTIAYTADDAAIGRHSHVDRAFDGLIDEVDLFSRALSAEEIQAIFAAGAEGKCLPE